MTSIIKNAATLGITYKATASDIYQSHYPSNVFTDSTSSRYESTNTVNSWWQISFSKSVSISSYIIKGIPDSTLRPKNWIIEAYLDSNIWETVDTQTGIDTGINRNPFVLKQTVKCKYFRIVSKGNWGGWNDLQFYFFDCFGSIAKPKTKKVICSRYVSYFKYKIFVSIYTSSYSSFLLS